MAARRHLEKLTFSNTCHGKACNMPFKGFSDMQNPILMLYLHFNVPEEPNSRWPMDVILENITF